MFDSEVQPTGEVATTAVLRSLRDALALLDPEPAGGDAERVEQLRLLEEVKAAAAAAQMRVAVAFDASQRQAQRDAGVRERHVGTGIAHQVGLALRRSPAKARRFLGLANVVAAEMPATLAELEAGRTTEARALSVARETVFLDREDRQLVDATIAPRLEGLGDLAVETETRALAQRLDPAGAAERAGNAASERRVTARPAPDTMPRLSALLPVATGVAAYAALAAAADAARAAGDERGRGQVMADTLVERITGQADAEDVSAEIQLVMTPETLFNTDQPATGRQDAGGPDADDGADLEADRAVGFAASDRTDCAPAPAARARRAADEPAHLVGYGPIPADLARRLVAGTAGSVFVRRLWSTPDRSRFLGIETHRARFDGALRALVVARDQRCRTPWCDAPVRHVDHPVPRREGGETTAETGQGLCEACNYAKEALGWRARPGPGGAGAAVLTTTPTGHTYTSVPPRPPGAPPCGEDHSPWERALTRLLAQPPPALR